MRLFKAICFYTKNKFIKGDHINIYKYLLFSLGILLIQSCSSTKNISNAYSISGNNSDITEELTTILQSKPSEINFKKGTYFISSYIHVANINDLKINGNSAEIIMKSYPSYNNPGIFKLYKCRNIKIENLKINGNRSQSELKGVSTVYIIDSDDITLDRCVVSNSNGDGIHITSTTDTKRKYSSRIKIENCIVNNSTRNGISVVRGDDIQIINTEIASTHGLRPEAGIDIEPNNHSIIPGAKNIVIDSCNIHNNAGNGIAIPHVGVPTNISIKNSSINDNLSAGIWSCGVDVEVISNTISNNKKFGIIGIRYPEYGVGVDSLLITNNIISNTGVGIQYRGTGGVVKDNKIENTREEGIELLQKQNVYKTVLIEGNRLKNIQGRYAISTNFDETILRSNFFDTISQSAIGLYNGKTLVEGNKLNHVKKNGVDIINAISNIENNEMKSIEGHYVYLHSIGDLTSKIINNRFYSTQDNYHKNIIEDRTGHTVEFLGNEFYFKNKPVVNFIKSPLKMQTIPY